MVLHHDPHDLVRPRTSSTSIDDPAGEYLMALLTRLSIT